MGFWNPASVQPAAESPASRWNRDAVQSLGDWQNSSPTSNTGLSGQTLVYNTSTMSRKSRTFLQQGGDVYFVATTGGLNAQIATYGLEVNGRVNRLYVDPTTHLSAITGEQSDIFTGH